MTETAALAELRERLAKARPNHAVPLHSYELSGLLDTIERLQAERDDVHGALQRLLTYTAQLDLGDKEGGPDAVIDNIITGIERLQDRAAQAERALEEIRGQKPVAWMCELAQEDGSTATHLTNENPEGFRWNDIGEPSPFRVTPLIPAQPGCDKGEG